MNLESLRDFLLALRSISDIFSNWSPVWICCLSCDFIGLDKISSENADQLAMLDNSTMHMQHISVVITVQSNHNFTLSHVITSILVWLHRKCYHGLHYVVACLKFTSASNIAMSVHVWQLIVQGYNSCHISSCVTVCPTQHLKWRIFCI